MIRSTMNFNRWETATRFNYFYRFTRRIMDIQFYLDVFVISLAFHLQITVMSQIMEKQYKKTKI